MAEERGLRTYVVQPGDTLIAIAEKVYHDPKAFTDILNANQDVIEDAQNLQPGTELYIPPSAVEIHEQVHRQEPGLEADQNRQKRAG